MVCCILIWPPLRVRCLHIVHIPLWVLSQINFLWIWQKSYPKYHQKSPPVWHPSSFIFPRESSSRYLPHPSLCNVLSISCGCTHAHFFPLPIAQPLQVLATSVWAWRGAELGVFMMSLQQRWKEAHPFGLQISLSFLVLSNHFFFSNKISCWQFPFISIWLLVDTNLF